MAYYGQICAVLDSLEAADQSIMAASFTPRGRLRIGMPMSYGLIRLNPLSARFQRRYPEIGIEVILSDAYMDLVDQGLDVVLRGAGTLEDSTLRAKPLCEVQRVLCAAPDYLKEAGQPAHPADLQGLQLPALQPLLLPNKWFLHPGRGERGGGAAPRQLLRQQRHRPETGGGAGARGDPGTG